MNLSIFDIFKVGIGPSSSHTFGPMVAANMFIKALSKKILIRKVNSIQVDLYGSLALTGKGHGTFLAIELGLEGWTPNTLEPNEINNEIQRIKNDKNLLLGRKNIIPYDRTENFKVHKDQELEYHSNGMSITAFDKHGKIIYSQTYYSIGGGFVITQEDIIHNKQIKEKELKYKFTNFKELLEICEKKNLSIYDVVLANEKCFRKEKEINEEIKNIIYVMHEMVRNGLYRKGNLEGSLNLPRRAPSLLKKLENDISNSPLNVFDWVSLWALAGAEENASLGKLITAPTNGASAVIPAVILFLEKYYPAQHTFENIKKFILVAGIIAILCKKNATISGAEGGCQAEIGSACAMAAAGLTAALGGTNLQCENAAIIGLVHNLGLTCDPIGGLVQIPCIERNAVNAVKAITASRIALREEKSLFITLDQAILTMKQVGKDMPCQYRETSQGGLAINSKNGRDTVIPTCVACIKNKKCFLKK
ncbi:MAG: L-serine ammonia-lyase [Rickettsiales bacterium]|nr:L-serine ammonia-lyase [Rickettsiales bacterium]